MEIVQAETSRRDCPAWRISFPVNPTVLMGFAQVTKILNISEMSITRCLIFQISLNITT